jgi:hypothetical protein
VPVTVLTVCIPVLCCILQKTPELVDVLNSFDLPEAELKFTFEELYNATNMPDAVSRLLSAVLDVWCRWCAVCLRSLCLLYVCCRWCAVCLRSLCLMYVCCGCAGAHCVRCVFAVLRLHRPQKLKLTDWMLVMCKLSEVQMNKKLQAVAERLTP